MNKNDFHIFNNLTDIDLNKAFDFVCHMGGLPLLEAMCNMSGYKYNNMNEVYLTALYNYVYRHNSLPSFNDILMLAIKRGNYDGVEIITKDNYKEFKDYNIISLNPIFDKLTAFITSNATLLYIFMNTKQAPESLIKMRYDYSKKS